VKVLISGGAGFVGSTVGSACHEVGISTVVLDDLSTGRREFVAGRPFYHGDISSGRLVDQIFTEHPDITAVIHCAAKIVVPESVSQPIRYYRENVAKSVEFVDHLLRNGCTRLVFSSTAALYAPNADCAVDEDSPLAPTSPYARTKVMFEWVLADVAAASDLRVLSLRYFNLVGADPAMRTGLQSHRPTHLLGKLIEAVDEGTVFEITGTGWATRDGTGIRDFIHVWDLAGAHVAAIQRFDTLLPPGGGYQVINLGTGRGTTVREMVSAFESVVGTTLTKREVGPRPGDVAGAYTLNDRARRLLGWTPQLTLEEGIRHSLEWAKLRDKVLPG
jgi:UDP-glucose 4-epimerase